MRVVTREGVRDLSRVTRHEILGGTHLLVEDMDGALYVWALAEVRHYGPIRHVEVSAADMAQPIRAVF